MSVHCTSVIDSLSWLFAVPRLLFKTRNGMYTSHHHFTTFENHVRVHHRQHQSRISCLQVSVNTRNRRRALHSSGDIQYAWPLCSHHTEGYTDNRACSCWDLQSLLGFFFWDVGCRMSTDRHRLSPLEQGGLEVACELIFVADDQKLLKKLKKDCIYTHTLTIIILFALVF